MKKFLLNLFFIFLCFILVGCSSNSPVTNTVINNTVNNTTNNSTYETEKLTIEPIKPKEEIIASFSTDILDKDSGRQTNISITCSTLTGTIVKSGETFSFCDTVGKATADRGYKEAKVFDADGNVVMGYGGGNCQVSSTLYNAILQDSNFEVIERHPHSHRVYYVEQDKDAAVACGSVDFKFKNNYKFDIKIYASTNGEQITTSIVKIY